MKILFPGLLMAPALTFAFGDLGSERTPTLVWHDFDGDALADLVSVDGQGALRLFKNLGDGGLEDVTARSGVQVEDARSAVWQDLDGDGTKELFVLRADGRSSLFQKDATGAFVDATSFAGLAQAPASTGFRFVDYDDDAHVDLVLFSAAGARLWHNDGTGFLSATPFEWAGVASATTGPLVRSAETASAGAGSVDSTGGSDAARRPARAAGSAADGASAGGSGGWSATASAGGSAATPSGGHDQAFVAGFCAPGIVNEASGACLTATSIPELGKLYPLTQDLFVDVDGEVGLGTLNPRTSLHVRGSGSEAGLRLNTKDPDGTAHVTLLENNNADTNLVGARVAYDGTADELRFSTLGSGTEKTRMVIDRTTGDVGIGTDEPLADLHVMGGANVGSIYVTPDEPGADKYSELVLGEDDDATFGMKVRYDGLNNKLKFQRFVSGTAETHLSIDRDGGKVGIGTVNPGGQLEVESDGQGAGNATVRAINTSTSTGLAFVAESNGDGTTAIIKQFGTGQILKGETTAGTVFRVSNTGRVVTTALEITGGGDLVEGFESDDRLEPGTVVAIDPANAGQLIASEGAYDTKVAGVVSGANGVNHGIRMGQHDVLDGDTLVAMAGRVWVRATAENGAIRPGDLLTTASAAGCAMRATDGERSFGAVIGKAMSGLDAETGLVLVLVNLQ